MPTREHLVLCGGVEGPKVLGRTTVQLDLHGPLANVKLSISDIARKLLVNIPDRLVDLLEIATYVYAADGAISRGGKTDSEMGARWRRTLRFKIPVREPTLWGSEPVSAALIETLSFLSDEQYAFDFEPFHSPPSLANYFDFRRRSTLRSRRRRWFFSRAVWTLSEEPLRRYSAVARGSRS
jgi:hypothetical protein